MVTVMRTVGIRSTRMLMAVLLGRHGQDEHILAALGVATPIPLR